ncbi:MAG: YicC/YloC family endoribonuclease [Paracoccaceae bacterium]
MTGFASGTGSGHGSTWSWDLRSVNGRGKDIRLRLPDWVDGLEAALRPKLQKAVARGNVNLTLRLSKDASGQGDGIDPDVLAGVLASIQQIEDAALNGYGLQLAPTTAADILALQPTASGGLTESETKEFSAILQADFDNVLSGFDSMRASEGAALGKVLDTQIDAISDLTSKAATESQARQGDTARNLQENLARVLNNSEGADPDRVAQELAILSLKSDITEEIDRLHAHVAAAKALLQESGPVGRKLDFLTQEFVRETNTLCSKAHSKEMTSIGLDLKAVIEQMREQVQNVE